MSHKTPCWYCQRKTESFDWRGMKACACCGAYKSARRFWPEFKERTRGTLAVIFGFMAGASCAIDTLACIIFLGMAFLFAHHGDK